MAKTQFNLVGRVIASVVFQKVLQNMHIDWRAVTFGKPLSPNGFSPSGTPNIATSTLLEMKLTRELFEDSLR